MPHVAMAIHIRDVSSPDLEAECLEREVLDLHVVVVPITKQELCSHCLDKRDPDIKHWLIAVAHSGREADRAADRLRLRSEVDEVLLDLQ